MRNKNKNDDKIIKFIDENEMYLQNRPNRFQHDDFHLENIIVRDGKYVGLLILMVMIGAIHSMIL